MSTTTRAPPVTEAAFLDQITDLLHLYGFRTYHTHDSRHSVAGFPDIVAVKERRCLYVELKAKHGRLSTEQKTWLRALTDAGQEVYLWRPDDLEQAARVAAGAVEPLWIGGET